jgi:hypothetical protein
MFLVNTKVMGLTIKKIQSVENKINFMCVVVEQWPIGVQKPSNINIISDNLQSIKTINCASLYCKTRKTNNYYHSNRLNKS